MGRHGVIGAQEARQARGPHHRPHPRRRGARPRSTEARDHHRRHALAERYLREHVAVRCKPTTAAQYRLAIERYVVPALGTRPVSALGRSQVADLQHSLSDRPAMANLVIATLSRMIDQAMAWGVAGEISNPCRSAPKYRTRRRERFLTDAEFQRLGRVLDEMEAEGRLSPYAAAALRLLMLTGCRRNEILTLRWEDVRLDAQELHLTDSKTGPRTVSLSPEAAQVLAWHSRQGARQPLGDPRCEAWRPAVEPVRALAPGARPRRTRRRARPRPATLLRQSRALALGESLPVIAKLLGHAQIQTTARYTHLTRNAVKDAAIRVAEGIADDIFPATSDPSSLPVRGGGCRGAGLARICAVGAAKRLHSPSGCGALSPSSKPSGRRNAVMRCSRAAAPGAKLTLPESPSRDSTG